MTFTKSVVFGGLLLAAGGPALAQVTGPYIGVGAGCEFPPGFRPDPEGTGCRHRPRNGHRQHRQARLRRGQVRLALGNLGWGFNNGIRTELEFSYRSNGVGSVSIAGYPAHPQLTGTTSTSAVMANVLYDVRGLGWRLGVPVTPHVGLGAGYAWSAYDRVMTRSGNDGSMTYGIDGRFAYQAILGLDWDLSSVKRGLSLSTQYRYFSVLDPQVEHGVRIGRAGFRDAKVETTNHNHSLIVGLRYAFRSPGVPIGVLP